MIVKSPDHQAVLLNKRALCCQHGIVFFLLEIVRLVEVLVEGRLVRDDQILSRRRGALEHIQRGHHSHRDAFDLRVRIARLERVHRLLLPGNSDMCLNARNHVARG